MKFTSIWRVASRRRRASILSNSLSELWSEATEKRSKLILRRGTISGRPLRLSEGPAGKFFFAQQKQKFYVKDCAAAAAGLGLLYWIYFALCVR